ncbi:MAG TPA: UDP-N-acetylmuramoyl-tripeptide--D-alanyl-D-alanine ligase [Armatimonadota bacterium]|nr:UDP-N-acetylmuramoyl-tripeptide--D-alanyl-D-alanine ligase [Armatimonadota bacterium]
MEKLFVHEIVTAVEGELLLGDSSSCVVGVSTDTRTVKPGDLFFALKGARADGHRYVGAAAEAGAAGVVISDESAAPSHRSVAVVKVDDPLWALGDLARYYRNKFDVRIVGVTGSVGKTTTKEMLASILARKWKVLKNAANFNNEIGVPLTLFRLDRSYDVAVLEMAMRGLGEIRRLASIAGPSVGIITNIGIAHIERLGSQGAIANAKAELLEELPPDGLAVINAEDGYFEVMRRRFSGRVVSFGSCKGADVVGARIKCSSLGRYSFALLVEGGAVSVKMPVLGHHNVYNALAAAAAAVGMGVDLGTIRDGLESFSPPAMRMELVKSKAGYIILNDAYNASPASMLSALKTLDALTGRKRKIAVLGDMLELGSYAPKAHRDIGGSLACSDVQMLVTVGPLGKMIGDGARGAGFPEDRIQSCADSSEAAQKLAGQLAKGDAVLVKGSRAMKMEEIVRVLLSD